MASAVRAVSQPSFFTYNPKKNKAPQIKKALFNKFKNIVLVNAPNEIEKLIYAAFQKPLKGKKLLA
jgi:hypothetical protein